MYSGDYRAALGHFETAALLYRPDEHRDSAFRCGQDIGVSAFVQLSWALWHRGYPDQSARAADRALAYSRKLGHAQSLSHAFYFAGMAAVFARDVGTACAYGNDCVAVASEHGFALWAAVGRILQGWADAQKGEATAGIARIRDGFAAREATGSRLNTPLFLALLAEALALAGKIEEALAALDDALAKAAVVAEQKFNGFVSTLGAARDERPIAFDAAGIGQAQVNFQKDCIVTWLKSFYAEVVANARSGDGLIHDPTQNALLGQIITEAVG